MGLRNVILIVTMTLVMVGCAVKQVVAPVSRKRYLACCDPGLNAEDKDKCRWLDETNRTMLRDPHGDIYEGVWDGCERGKEPWRQWE